MVTSLTPTDRSAATRRGRRLEYFTIGWNAVEGLIAVAAGALAGSISLVGFGIDSFIEVTSGAAVLWRMHGDHDGYVRERRERISLRVVGVCFVALGAYVAFEAIDDLVRGSAPLPSRLGIAVAGVSLVVMPLLAREKRDVARSLDSGAMRADSKQTDFCAYLSAILLGGLLLNVFVGWGWADPVAALLMTPLIFREGIIAFRGETCCD